MNRWVFRHENFSVNALIALAFTLPLAQPGQAQGTSDYPNRSIHIVIGTAAGGGTDTIIRLIQSKLQKQLGVPIVIHNRPGGSNQIAVQAVTSSATDGYTLLAGTTGMLTINPAVYTKLLYNTMRDLVPISIVCEYPMVIAVDAAAPVNQPRQGECGWHRLGV